MSGSEAEERIRAKAEAMLRQAWPHARIVHELVLEQGGCRIDLAAIGVDHLTAVEIKSERDTFRRLKAQIEAAVPVATEVWLCIAAAHEEEVDLLMSPTLPGTQREKPYKRGTALVSDPNPDHIPRLARDVVVWIETDDGFRVKHQPWERRRFLDPRAQLQMLWADELRWLASGASGWPRRRCMAHALEHLTGREIRRRTHAALRERTFPRADASVPIEPTAPAAAPAEQPEVLL